MKSLAILVAAVVLVQLFDGGDAGECCRPTPGYSNGQVTLNCGDCKPGTPYCGVGRCNIWGCNCDGGCRKGTCNGFFSSEEVQKAMDKDHDGKISPEEGRAYLSSMNIDAEHVDATLSHADATPDTDGFLNNEIFSADIQPAED